MAAPLVIAIGALAGAAAIMAKEAIRVELRHIMSRHRDQIERWALDHALEAAGLPGVDDLTQEGITAAINESLSGAGVDVQLSNVFSATAVRADFERIALARVASAAGLSIESPTPQAVADGLREWVVQQIRDQVEAGGGDLIDGAPELSELRAIIDAALAARERRESMPVSMTPEAISNRERQARYRATHTRHWEERA